MKYLLINLLALITINCNAQDTTFTNHGYELDFPNVHIKVDTLHHISQVYNFYHKRMYFSIDSRKAVELPSMGGVMTVWREHFTVTVTKKKYREIYKI